MRRFCSNPHMAASTLSTYIKHDSTFVTQLESPRCLSKFARLKGWNKRGIQVMTGL